MTNHSVHNERGNDVEKESMLGWQRQTTSRWQQHRRFCLILLATLVASFAGFAFVYHSFDGTDSNNILPSKTMLAGEVNNLVPDFPLSPQIWSNNSLYGPEEDIEDLPSHELDQLMKRWKALLPRGYGFVPIHEPEKYILPPPLKYDGLAPPDYYYSVSVFHQMHCLSAILQTFISDRTGFSHGAHERREDNRRFHHSRHILHCFDYLRQAIMCYGDTALEGADEYSIAEGRDEVLVGTSGIGTTRMCKNYDDLINYAEAHANPEWMGSDSRQYSLIDPFVCSLISIGGIHLLHLMFVGFTAAAQYSYFYT